MGPYLRIRLALFAVYLYTAVAHHIPREPIQALCPNLLNRGVVADYDQQASWEACGQGAFQESQDVSVDLLDVTRVLIDDQRWGQAFSESCKGLVSLENLRVVKACQSTVDSRDIFAILRAQISCSETYIDVNTDEYSYEAEADDDDDDSNDHGCDGDGDSDDYFCLYREGGPLVVEALWVLQIDVSSGEFQLEDLCYREMPVVPN